MPTVIEEYFNIMKQADDKKDFIDNIEDKRINEDEDLIEKAHPAPVYVADALGDGGLVENKNEQHKKDQEVVNKMPTGELTALYCSISANLLKLANQCDLNGDTEAADMITETALEFLPLV